MKVTWLGQSGFLFETQSQRLLIDPFYSDIVEQRQGIKRLVSAPIPIEDLHPDYIFITHDHLDHLDPIALPEIHRQYPQAKIVGPESVMRKALELEFDPGALIQQPKGASHTFGAFKITSTAAYHSDPFAVGMAIEVEGKRIYYSGDTLLMPTLYEEIYRMTGPSPDLVFIVINGRLGNMNVQEAIALTAQLQPSLAIPMHYGMFAENTEDPYLFLAGCDQNQIKAMALTLGKTVVL